ncbi:MAG: hypothetical protein ACRC20_09795 [Segniliparus sp.]|uniref:hypothetical protein n=1 Tax=Segniliparus sp. TaxID=2804064 RepID=UPI003F4140B1
MTQPTDLAPHRLVLPADELAHLVDVLGCDLPPSWRPKTPDPTAEQLAARRRGLVERRAMTAEGSGAAAVHPSVAMNLHVLARPQAMLATTAHIGSRGVRSLHAVAGIFGASLFQLDGGKLELSFFPAVDLGKELARAVPPEAENAADLAKLFGDEPREPLTGTLPLRAVEELGLAVTLRAADPPGVGAVLEALALPESQDRLAGRLADETDGLLTCDLTGRSATGPVADRIVWLHAAGSWIGLRPDMGEGGERLVQLEPAQPGALGVWAAGFLAAVLS